MLNRTLVVLAVLAVCLTGASAQTPCPGYNPNDNTNLTCAIATATGPSPAAQRNLSSFASTLATQLSQLPIATAISGTGIIFGAAGPRVSPEGLGTILTQRGDTLGKHKFFVSFTYQHFNFDSIDGVSLDKVPSAGTNEVAGFRRYVTETNAALDISVHQYTALASVGLTNRIDVSVVVPFSTINLTSKATINQHEFDITGATPSFVSTLPILDRTVAGSATGIGDLIANVKVNVMRGERSSVAVGSEVRFPTGDAFNYLGSGAYGFKPYVVFSRRGRLTPNVNIGYQWNGTSDLYTNPATGAALSLPGSLLYSGGVDFKVVKKLTLTGEFLGQYVIDGPRLALSTVTVGGRSYRSVNPVTESYAMNNFSVGVKVNPFRGLLISASAQIKLDDPGLRSNVVPLIGVAYKF
jgi:hypothetical protein